ncbi:MAG: hypothetical protein ACM3UT_02445 [Chloroflexota bacterium]
MKISKSELIKTFSEIDNKINNLYRRSTSDFMQLNNYLKDYHKKTRIIASNAFRIIETISGEKDTNLIKELGKINYRLDDCIEKINEEDIRKIQNLKEIIHKSNQCNIIIQNLRQDLTTFKFLSSNFNIILNYRDLGRENTKIENTWSSDIKSLKEALLLVSTHTEIFKEQITYSITCIDSRIKSSMDIFRSLSQETRTNISSVVLKSLESKLHLPTLKERTRESSRRIDDIIKHLQYHDIICQKIDHIQKSHRRVIEEMGNPSDTLGCYEDCLPEDCTRVCDIIDLQSAQLLLVSKEYQNALDVITSNFLGVAKEVTAISDLSGKLSFRDNSSQFTIIRQIKDLLDKGIIMLDLHNFNEINEEFNVAGRNMQVILEDVAGKIHPLITGFVSRNKIIRKCRQEEADPGILKEMSSLVDAIELRYSDLTEKLNNIKGLYDNIFRPHLMDAEDFRLEMDRLQLMVSISKILESIDRDNEELDIVLNQNRDLNDSILEKIETAIKRKDYYEYFESIVEEVIEQLNEINTRIKPEENSTGSGKADNLEHMKAAYTMASERIVHENVVTGGGEINSQGQARDNEVEFF